MLVELALSAALAMRAEQPPECVTVTVGAYQRDGTIRREWLVWCGNGPGGDSPMRDRMDGRRFTLDGALGIGVGCGGRSDPCVIFPGG